MARYSKFNPIYLMQKWMDSVAGQTFMNYAYSWGAAIVILGTLFKLTHLEGANLMLFIGMGTEVFVFFISAFDRPFDKTADGMNLATDTELEALAAAEQDDDEDISEEDDNEETEAQETVQAPLIIGGGNVGTGTIVIGGGNAAAGSDAVAAAEGTAEGIAAAVSAPVGGVVTGAITGGVIGAPAPAVTPETAVAMEEATTTYVDRLNELNDLLLKVAAQSDRLTTDSEEMENLNRTLTGISRVYEMQLKSASQQMATQDQINDQTRRLAEQIQELNAIYARMIQAMTTNMPGAAQQQ